MADYSLRWSKQALKELDRLPQKIAERVYDHVTALGKSPRPHGALKLKGRSDNWRIRVGDYRVLYTIADSVRGVSILAVQHRKDVYRGL